MPPTTASNKKNKPKTIISLPCADTRPLPVRALMPIKIETIPTKKDTNGQMKKRNTTGQRNMKYIIRLYL